MPTRRQASRSSGARRPGWSCKPRRSKDVDPDVTGPRRIAMIVSPWFPVPPRGYGGIELMAYHLARELQRRGNEVSVIGQQGSKGPFETIAIAPESWSSRLGTRDELPRQNLFLYRAYDLVHKRAFDVVHDHSGLSGILLAANTRLQNPVV